MSTGKFCVEYAKRGTAGCKKCKQKIDKGVLRIAKIVPNPFTDSGGDMKQWFHVDCVFETFVRARATTKKIEDPSDLDGWEEVLEEDRKPILQHMSEIAAKAAKKAATPSKKKPATPAKAAPTPSPSKSLADKTPLSSPVRSRDADINAGHRDNSFREFRRLCAKIAEEASYLSKTKIVSDFFTKGTGGDGFHGDLYLFVKLLLPGFVKRVYNLQSKQLVNHFSIIFGASAEDMIEHLEKGDVADTVQTYFELSKKCPPANKSILSIQDVDEFLENLTTVTKDEDQIKVLEDIAIRCTANDLKVVIRLIKKDLRINSGAKHILEGVHPDAYEAFQASRNLEDVIERVLERRATAANGKPGLAKALSIKASLMTPVLPMLAEACKSVEYAMKKCPNGMYAEIKYDGERVQVHKQGNDFSYFSRSLKPVLPHKVGHFKDYIPQAFPHGQSLILDSEVLLIDTQTGTPLPFGTLGVHKKVAFKDATVCLFVFDCIHLNGENLMNKPLKERRQILQANMTEVPNHVKFSEMKHITVQLDFAHDAIKLDEILHPDDLKDMIMEVLRKGLEGLVLKDCMSLYEPGKRHWLKVKKDYLAEGVMADSADLVVVGAFYGTGNKGGMMSIFLMGCVDPKTDTWCTVTKVSGGHDDKTLESLQDELKMVKISKDVTKVPSWLKVTKNMVPDFICEHPKKSQVWEIVGAEFSKAESHTADGISIRFPRVTRIRRDKTWKEATTLPELKVLFEKSKDHENLPDLLGRSGKSETKSPAKNTNTSGKETPKSKSRKTNTSHTPSKDQPSIFQFVQTANANKRSLERASTSTQKELPDLPSAKRLKIPDTSKDEYQHSQEILPDVFKGTTIFISKSIKDFELLCRYVVAYDGDVVDQISIERATHVVLNFLDDKPETVSKSTKLVNQQWLLDSIILQKVQNPLKYEWKKH